MLLPANGAKLSGRVILDAAASDTASVPSVPVDSLVAIPINQVEICLTGGTIRNLAIGTTPTLEGWIAVWKSTQVMNGTYSLHSRARNAQGHIANSADITVTVSN